MKCNHTWVMYQPLIGEPFECCSKCPMKKSDVEEPSLFGIDASEYAVWKNHPLLGGAAAPTITPIYNNFNILCKVQSSFNTLELRVPAFYQPQGRGSPFHIAQARIIPVIEWTIKSNNYIGHPLHLWLPINPPGPTSPLFHGVDRSTDLVRLAGIRYDGWKEPLEESITQMSVLINSEGGNATDAFLHPDDFDILDAILGTTPGGAALYLTVCGAGGSPIRIWRDDACRRGVGYVCDISTWVNDQTFGIYSTCIGHNGIFIF